ncbi:MAG TPA: isocitrate lyase/phosphoenolpyruvate mutase family protein [Edaphobacter sp.]|nr:isocitrate lyase/phosphoenolpyruvate mutase family protein [Edaphobacter sp.]
MNQPKAQSATSQDFTARRAAFRKLHQGGLFVIPNPWDVGTARYLRSLGFKALATTSAGMAFAHGLPDADWAVPRDLTLHHIATIAASVDLPINADFESGYAHDPEGVAHNVRLCINTGVAGLSIEDATGNPQAPLYDLPLAVERIRAARAAIDASRTGVLLTARAECYLVGHPDPLTESLRRLQAYAEAGADVLYAPGPTQRTEVEAIVAAVHPKPVNILLSSSQGLQLSDLAAIGVRRVSVGSSLARAAWTGFIHAARKIALESSMAGFDDAIPYSELNEFFRKDHAQRAIEDAETK